MGNVGSLRRVMFYSDAKESYSTPSGSSLLAAPLAIFVLVLLIGSFLPGMPKGAVFAHEWGTHGVPMPLRLPLIRPVLLKRGETLEIEYSAKVRTGRLAVKVAFSEDVLTLLLARADERALSLSQSGSGAVRYTALKTGYYLFSPTVEPPSNYVGGCHDILGDFWAATRAEPSPCPSYNVSYRLSYF